MNTNFISDNPDIPDSEESNEAITAIQTCQFVFVLLSENHNGLTERKNLATKRHILCLEIITL